jgi:hypothetical protein
VIHHMSSLRPSTESTESCEALWRANSEYRRLLYKADANLMTALTHTEGFLAHEADYNLDVSEYHQSFGTLMATKRPALRDMMKSLDAFDRRSFSNFRSVEAAYKEVFSRTENVGVIHQFQSAVLRLQRPDANHVPLFGVSMDSGFHGRASLESLSKLIRSLRLVQTIPRVIDEETRVYLQDMMKTMRQFITMMTVANRNTRVAVHDSDSSTSSPRSCRLSRNPVADIDRLAREFVESMDFCRGLLFRFVPRETRDSWMSNFHELYDLFEQLLDGQSGFSIETYNVRLTYPSDRESMERSLERIRNSYGSLKYHLDLSRNDLIYIRGELESLLQLVEGRSLMERKSLIREIDTGETTARGAVGEFIAIVDPLFRERRYLSILESVYAIRATRVAFWSISRLLTHSLESSVPVSLGSNTESIIFEVSEP